MKKMTRDEALELHQACEELIKSSKMKFKHLYAVTRTKNFSESVKKESENNLSLSQEYYAFTEEVQKEINKYAEKQPNKDVIRLGPDGYPVFKDQEMEKKATDAVKKLRSKYKDALAQQKEKEEKRDAFMSEEVEVNVYQLLNESEISDISLSLLAKTRHIYVVSNDKTEKKTFKKEDIITTFIFAKNERGEIPYDIKMLVLFNLIQLSPVVESIIKDSRYKEFYEIYDVGLNAIKEKYGKRDIYGELYMKRDEKGQRVIVLEDTTKFNEATEAYKKKHKKMVEGFDALREEEVEVEVAMLTEAMQKALEEMPEVGSSMFQVLFPFIKE